MDSELWKLYEFDTKDLHILKLCLRQQFVTEKRLRDIIEQSCGQHILYALSDSQILSAEQLAELLQLRKKSILCPHCQELNFVNSNATDIFCQKCYKFINLLQILKQEQRDISANPTNQKFGSYEVLEILGQGSMGIVYKARHIKLERYAAIKVLKNELTNPELIAYFMREAKSAAALQHPTIVTIYDVNESCGQYYIAMEYVVGKRLSEFIISHPPEFDLKSKLMIVKQIAQGLYHAHQHGIIHRDIKPDNIMITQNGNVKITDFGLARQVHPDVQLTQYNQRLGTPLYMSPEQIDGLTLSPSTDIYSLGIVFYEMLTGKTPFYHTQICTLFQKIMNETVLRPRTLYPEIPQCVEDICLKAMAKNPQERFQNANEIVIAIDEYLQHGTANYKSGPQSNNNSLLPNQYGSSIYPPDLKIDPTPTSDDIREIPSLACDEIGELISKCQDEGKNVIEPNLENNYQPIIQEQPLVHNAESVARDYGLASPSLGGMGQAKHQSSLGIVDVVSSPSVIFHEVNVAPTQNSLPELNIQEQPLVKNSSVESKDIPNPPTHIPTQPSPTDNKKPQSGRCHKIVFESTQPLPADKERVETRPRKESPQISISENLTKKRNAVPNDAEKIPNGPTPADGIAKIISVQTPNGMPVPIKPTLQSATPTPDSQAKASSGPKPITQITNGLAPVVASSKISSGPKPATGSPAKITSNLSSPVAPTTASSKVSSGPKPVTGSPAKITSNLSSPVAPTTASSKVSSGPKPATGPVVKITSNLSSSVSPVVGSSKVSSGSKPVTGKVSQVANLQKHTQTTNEIHGIPTVAVEKLPVVPGNENLIKNLDETSQQISSMENIPESLVSTEERPNPDLDKNGRQRKTTKIIPPNQNSPLAKLITDGKANISPSNRWDKIRGEEPAKKPWGIVDYVVYLFIVLAVVVLIIQVIFGYKLF